MTENRFNYCPDCGSRNIQTKGNGRKWLCPDCGLELYNNVAAAVGVILQNGKGEILFEKRAKEPAKGKLALPGGFLEPGERAESGAVRECREETGVEIEGLDFLCSFPNTYEYKGLVYKTCDLFFTARLPENCRLKAEESEVSGFVWLKLETPADVEKAPLAFPSAVETLKFFLREAGKA